MAKTKTTYYCQSCGAQSSKWTGQCYSCKAWNTIAEEVISTASVKDITATQQETRQSKAQRIQEIDMQNETRIDTTNKEFNRVLGGGLVPGSVILLGGEPGIGKSTLLLQIALSSPLKVLYTSGEESSRQIKMRAERIDNQKADCYILTETNTQKIGQQLEELQPDLVIVDSIQTLHSNRLESAAGTVSQIRECAAELIQYAKQTHTPMILVGHITKEGQLAGPKLLEHMVDTVLQFEGDRNYVYRILRGLKNRFGNTSELGIYEMQSNGLKEVNNPSELLLSNHEHPLSGIAISATVEGQRPLMIEIQALVSSAVYGTPQRSTTGFNAKRLNMLLAVLEKKAGFKLGAKDVFLNITGGIQVDDPAIDLAVVMAVLSSSIDLPISTKSCFAAEVGLAGEIRPVQRINERISEAEKLGFSKIYISEFATISIKNPKIEILKFSKVEDLVRACFKTSQSD